MSKSRVLQLLVSVAIGAGCLWLAFRDVPLDEAKTAIARVPWWVHGVYVLSLFAQFVLRSLRWSIQVQGQAGRAPSLKDSLAINAVSFAAVFLIPFRLGELVRPYLGAQRGLMRKSTGLAHSAVERILDGLVTTAFFALVLVLLGEHKLPDEVRYAGWLGLLIFGGASVVLALAFWSREASERFWRKLIGLLHKGLADKLVGMLGAFLDGVACFRSLGAFFGYVALTVVYWLMNGAAMWVVLWGMGTGAGPLVAYFALCFLVISVMLPAPPGNVGNFHAFAKWALTLLGVAEGPALAYAIILHAWQVATLLVWAGVFVLRGDVSLAKVREATSGEEDPGLADGAVAVEP